MTSVSLINAMLVLYSSNYESKSTRFVDLRVLRISLPFTVYCIYCIVSLTFVHQKLSIHLEIMYKSCSNMLS